MDQHTRPTLADHLKARLLAAVDGQPLQGGHTETLLSIKGLLDASGAPTEEGRRVAAALRRDRGGPGMSTHPLMSGEPTDRAGARALQARAAAAITCMLAIEGLPPLTWHITPVLSVRLHSGPGAVPVATGMASTLADLRAWAGHHGQHILWPADRDPYALISTDPAIRVYCPRDLALGERGAA